MKNDLNTMELLVELGHQIRGLRLRQDLDQRELARRAGVALNAVKTLESGKGATLKSMIRVLRVLQRTEWLFTLAPQASVSPLQMAKSRKERKRVTPRKVSTHV